MSFIKKWFNDGSDFSAYYAATNFLALNGYSYGSMERDQPIGILKVKGGVFIAKWKNLTASDREQLDGKITFQNGGPRNGDATIMIYERFEERALAPKEPGKS